MLEQPLGDRHGAFHVFDGFDGNACGDPADDGQFFFAPVGVIQQLNAPRAVTVQLDIALAFKGTEMIRGRILGLEPHDVGNLCTGGGHAAVREAFADAIENLLLSVGKFAAHNLLPVSCRVECLPVAVQATLPGSYSSHACHGWL